MYINKILMKNKLVNIGLPIAIIVVVSIVGHYFVFEGPFSDEEQQDIYFSKVSYHLEGKVVDYDFLGGGTCLVKIQVDSSAFGEIMLEKGDDFVGLYDKESKIAYMVNIFLPPVDDFFNRKLLPHELPYLRADTKTREIIYSGGVYNDTVTLRPTENYKNDIKRKEWELSSEFRF
jgi:hypothetical protein